MPGLHAHAGQRKFRVFRRLNANILKKIARCARQGHSHMDYEIRGGNGVAHGVKIGDGVVDRYSTVI
jgi:hypothetical protein